MKNSSFQNALDSAAKIALGCLAATAGACGGLSRLELEPATTASAPPAASPEPAPSVASSALACISPVGVIDRQSAFELAPADAACCKTHVEKVAGTAPAPPKDTLLADASLLNCCRALAWSRTFEAGVAHDTCCYSDILAPGDLGQSYCSPWGPPVPPALVLT